MGTENVMHYVLMYILPSIFLYILGTYILVRSYPYKTAKLVAASIFCSAIGYTVDFIRVLLPIEFNNFLQQITEARCAFQLNLYKQDEIAIEIVPSLGIAFVDEDGTDYEHLYHVCDVRMYEDKKIMKEQFLQRQG